MIGSGAVSMRTGVAGVISSRLSVRPISGTDTKAPPARTASRMRARRAASASDSTACSCPLMCTRKLMITCHRVRTPREAKVARCRQHLDEVEASGIPRDYRGCCLLPVATRGGVESSTVTCCGDSGLTPPGMTDSVLCRHDCRAPRSHRARRP
ncbi:hypothetical protein ACFPRL_34690 [Pseudoclavibacter helvolus]